jgi:prephenate dehydrogenase
VNTTVIGTGLIGTSIALALREQGARVWLADSDPAAARLAADLGAGEPLPAGTGEPADVAVIAVPPAAVAATLAEAQARNLADCYTDVASVKQLPITEAREHRCDLTRYVPGHPLAGREKHGPAAARADLFLGCTWALCPLPETSSQATTTVTALVRACGAVPVRTDPAAHDRWVALISHAPHLVAAAMAARLEEAPGEALDLAGPGLRDVTRIAAGDTALWTQILSANAAPVAEVLGAVAADLAEAARTLADSDDPDKGVATLLDRGRSGVARIPGKHGSAAREFAVVQVVIPDQPGELARLFQATGAAGVNIEDVRIEHSPGLPVGVAELSVRPGEAGLLLQALEAGGWPVRRLSGTGRRLLPPGGSPPDPPFLCRTDRGACLRGPRVRRAVRVPLEDPERDQQAAHRPPGQDREVAAGHDGRRVPAVLQRTRRGVDHRLDRQVADRRVHPVRQALDRTERSG